MEFKCQITEDEYVQANKLFSRLSKKHWLLYAIAIPGFIATAVLTNSEIIRYGAIFGLIGGFVGHLVVRYLLAPWQCRRQYRKYKAIHESFDISLEKEGIRFIEPDSSSLLKWNHLMKWRENSEFILVYQNPKLYHPIPKRFSAVGVDILGIHKKLEKTIGSAT